ncbi:MAG: hypothetical protein JJU32_04670 [Phormidium sp. BM_Day4_Bin.17]|nr:hypothetical protein [Phormidium sp. BM_Day4_Bin.17]UCJ10626.1 MAG: hypothetical protein JWS08_12305 [Phormidium sp. PBR-2020]
MIQELSQKLESPLPANIKSSSPSPTGLAYLIIGTFPNLQDSSKFRVVPELCYGEATPSTPERESLVQEDCSVSIEDFPKFLHEIVAFAEKRLHHHYDPRPWQLRISLSLPTTALGSPLFQWCGESSPLPGQHPIVVGCSDRVNPDYPRRFHLYNRLKFGWERFFRPQRPLKELNWLITGESSQEDWETYEAVQCWGRWLRCHQAAVERWYKLIESGIPLALWLDEDCPHANAIAQTFTRLTNCCHEEFLDRVRRERRSSDSIPFGVFYENPNYLPTVAETSDEQFFSWG